MWDDMLEAYHKLKKNPSTIAELQTTLQKIRNEAPKPVSMAIQNLHKRLQAYVNKAGRHFEHFIWHIQHCFGDRHSLSKQLCNYW